MNASNFYKLEGDKLVRTHRTCPKCGTGYYLADHYDRSSCGRCGYTIFKRKGKKPTATTGSEKEGLQEKERKQCKS